MNLAIIEQFELLVKQIRAEYLNAQVENQIKEMKLHQFRLKNIKRAITIIKSLDFKITDSSDLDGIAGIGTGIKKRIQEILDTGTLSELQNKYDKIKQDKINSIQELEQVIGIGSATAKKLVTQYNITSVSELKNAIKHNKIKVNDLILLGIKYYGIVQGNIPRKEVALIEKYLNKVVHQIDPLLELVICGSYRRGKKTSGDIDVLLYHPKTTTEKKLLYPNEYGLKAYLELFIDLLSKNKFLLDHMTDKNYNKKYMGFCKYKNYPVRRIDIRFVPYISLPTALLYFTGPYELNTIMRTAAKKRNMILNEYGLYKLEKNTKLDNTTSKDKYIKKLIKVNSEEDIFKLLGMKYLTPIERESFNSGKINKNKTLFM